jgi:hypothetical protein
MTQRICAVKATVSTNRMTKGSPLIYVFVELKNMDIIIVLTAKMLTWHIEINYVKNLCFVISLSLEDISFCFEMGDLFIDILEIVFWKSHFPILL